MLRLLAVTVVVPLLVIEFPVSVTVHESPDTRLPAVHVVECAEASYVQDSVPHESDTVFAVMLIVFVFADGSL